MRKLLIALVLMISGLVGCCPKGAGGDTIGANCSDGLVDSADQRCRRIRYIDTVQNRMLVDDWDMVWLNDRSTRLSHHFIYVGR